MPTPLVLALVLALLGTVWASPAAAQHRELAASSEPPTSAEAVAPPVTLPWWLSGGVHSAFLSDVIDGSWQGLTFGAELKLGFRGSSSRLLGVFLQLDTSFWLAPVVAEGDAGRPFDSVLQGALNVGLGADVRYFDDHLRGAFSAGLSVLLRDNVVDNAGSVGVFIDFRPAGVRVPLRRGGVLVIDPLTFTFLAPDLSRIPLVQIEYRTVLVIEFGLGGVA
ncbi:MAG: hypothetical protein R3B40_29940 [Polyangiales bacterium]|nr:hypothetical protein [Myxococcales bacterium]MCB9658170.1 hypothetical protein [Sandaracinaceae bacterium]